MVESLVGEFLFKFLNMLAELGMKAFSGHQDDHNKIDFGVDGPRAPFRIKLKAPYRMQAYWAVLAFWHPELDLPFTAPVRLGGTLHSRLPYSQDYCIRVLYVQQPTREIRRPNLVGIEKKDAVCILAGGRKPVSITVTARDLEPSEIAEFYSRVPVGKLPFTLPPLPPIQSLPSSGCYTSPHHSEVGQLPPGPLLHTTQYFCVAQRSSGIRCERLVKRGELCERHFYDVVLGEEVIHYETRGRLPQLPVPEDFEPSGGHCRARRDYYECRRPIAQYGLCADHLARMHAGSNFVWHRSGAEIRW